jgi:EAL domain-containing protein (putative c-di-GMP-specific phosphodiesterase class I)/cellulose synthase/poly-beta-1,6-N-acetylglucosamine synthase-like glycosyltransferase
VVAIAKLDWGLMSDSHKLRRRQVGADRRRGALSLSPPPITDRRMAIGRLAVIVTVLGWLAYFGWWLAINFFNGQPINSRQKVEAVVYLLIVSLLTASSLAYLVSRLGFFYRAKGYRRTDRATIDEFYDRSSPTLTILVPSYQEESRVIRTTILSAALQEYPYKRIVLLIDDPPNPKSRRHREMLGAARALPRQIEELLAEPSATFAAALERSELAHRDTAPDEQAMNDLAKHYHLAADWLERLAADQEIVDHTDAFFANEVLRRLAQDFSVTASALRSATVEGAILSRERMIHLYRRLAWTFRVQVLSFERKRYSSLSDEPNKAMNLNSYLGLMGGSFREVQDHSGRVLLPTAPGSSDLTVPDPDYVLTLDADSILLPEYCIRLVQYLEESEHSDVAIAQTPYSAFPGAGTRLERIAGATTDIQHIAHQGLTYYDATSWVGANAVIRKQALDQIMKVSHLGNWEIRTYVQDRTVVEDTDSTIDLALAGWRLMNIPERLSYSATPPDFGSLCIQRRRWSNGGLIILPKLVRLWRTRRRRGERTRFGEIYLRWNYMASIAWASLGLLVLLAFPFKSTLISPLLGLIAVPYFLAIASDLKYCGYKRLDVLRIYGLNLMLIGVNLAGTGESLVQAITAAKSAFGRTPKVQERTVVPLFFLFVPVALVGLAGYTAQHAYRHRLWENVVFAGINVILGLYAIVAFIGLRNVLVDTWVNVKEFLYKPAPSRRRRRRRRERKGQVVPEGVDWASVLRLGPYVPTRWPTSTQQSLIERPLRDVNDPLHPEVMLRPQLATREPMVETPGLLDFRTVFQPIFDLEQEAIVGYEALTRFADGTSPERRVAEAIAGGSGSDFELALSQAAISASMALSPGSWLAINASSRTLVNSPRFRTMVSEAPVPIVIEIKEPSTIDADAALRHATNSLPLNARLGLQNIGLEHASLSTVNNLRPSFIKVDQAILAAVDEDLALQAQLTTMINLARRISCEVIAAGIEDEHQLVVLRDLGVRYAQGYLLGRPAAVVGPGISGTPAEEQR